MTVRALTEDEIVRVAEHVLRLDGGADREAMRRAALEDPAIAREIADWEASLAPLLEEVADVAPPARVRDGLERRLFGAEGRAGRRRPGWGWLAAGFGAGAAAAGVAALLLVTTMGLPAGPPAGLGPIAVAEIETEGGDLRVFAAYDPAVGTVRLRVVAGAPPEGSDYELWAIGGDGVPVSLGLLPEQGTAPLPDLLRDGSAGLTFAISEEPTGGSPTGSPTRVLATAPVIEL